MERQDKLDEIVDLKKSKIPKISNEPLPPNFDVPQSYNQLNTILSYYNLPNLQHADSAATKAKSLIEIKKKFQGLEYDDEEIEKQINKIEELKKIERECDMLEIELANLKVDSMQSMYNEPIEDLEEKLRILRTNESNADLKKDYDKCRYTIDEISMGKSYDQLVCYKEETRGEYLKQLVIDKLKSVDDDNSRVLKKIITENLCKMDDIARELSIERVDLLRIIYNYSANGVLEYDRLDDCVSLKVCKK